eukprot:8769539-Pyramimonas_sp.AAC.1
MQQQSWYLEQEARLAREHASGVSSGPNFSWSITSVRGDATNTAVQHFKAHTCEIVSQYSFLQFDRDGLP